MANWFEDNPIKTIITYTILVGGSVFAFSKFVLIENTEQYYSVQLDAKNAEISQYEARISFLEAENTKLEEDINKYMEWLQNTPNSLLYVEMQNEQLKAELEKEKSNKMENIGEELQLKYYKEYESIGADKAIVDENIGVVLSINNITVSDKGDLFITIPNKTMECQS